MKFSGIQYLLSLAEWKGDGGFSLDKIAGVLKQLDNPQNGVPTIIVGGTNGKGSVSASIAAILGAAGNRVGLNVSPHLSTITERVVIDGLPIEEQALNEFALVVQCHSEKCGVRLSFHEAITVTYFLTVNELGLNWSVLEVGLGGRFDAANIVSSPKGLAIVTIGHDHEHILGGSLEEIAYAKAGIIKNDAILVTGRIPENALGVIEDEVRKFSVKHYKFGEDFSWNQINPTTYSYLMNNINELEFSPKLPGLHQVDNHSIAITLCRSLGVTHQDCRRGIAELFWPARLEWFREGESELLFDCAHNAPGIESLVAYLTSLGLRNLRLVFGVVSSKRWQEMVDLLKPFVAEWIVATPDVSQALDSSEIVGYLAQEGISSTNFSQDYEALTSYLLTTSNGSPTLITGSIYLLGNLRQRLVKEDRPIWKRSLN